MIKHARTDHPVHDLIARRWSPTGFADRMVPDDDLRALFEAARWAPSSYNEQPWSYFIATKADADSYAAMLSCLVEGNQAWARSAPVLALAVVTNTLARNGKPNRTASHDLGLATGNLLAEATVRGLHVHQMAGILRDRARELYAIPADSEAWVGLAIGYAAAPDTLDEPYRTKDQTPRDRKPISAFVFSGTWGEAADLVK